MGKLDEALIKGFESVGSGFFKWNPHELQSNHIYVIWPEFTHNCFYQLEAQLCELTKAEASLTPICNMGVRLESVNRGDHENAYHDRLVGTYARGTICSLAYEGKKDYLLIV